MTKEELKEQIMAFAPLIVSIISLTNTFLSLRGLPCIEIDNATVTTSVSAIATIASVLWAWWKNNNVTNQSQVSQEVLNCMKVGIVSEQEVLTFLNDKIDEHNSPEEEIDITEEVKEAVDRSEELDG